jgi:hypothetical protein
MATVLFFAGAYLIYVMSQKGEPLDDVEGLVALKQDAHAYSGANPEEFHLFLENLNKVHLYLDTPRVAAGVLYQSLDHLRNLTIHNNYNIEEEIEDIAHRIGEKVEERILEHAIKNKKRFHPKYLNERLY